ncbi:hypothetical protein ABVK25_011286 [Lepraria finkii]|uniref:Uncharacterized protein n=1 Tax=Lepraria finkii TaxID=1340010 RepID=A0ABR4AQJ7_9LECA
MFASRWDWRFLDCSGASPAFTPSPDLAIGSSHAIRASQGTEAFQLCVVPPRLTLPSQLPRLKHHEYPSQSTPTLNYDYSSPELQPTLDMPHQKPSLPQAPPKQLTVSQARSILKVSVFTELSEIRMVSRV